MELDHLIIPARDRVASARLLGTLLGVPWAEEAGVGPFSPVYVSEHLTLDFDQWPEPFPGQHYAFKVSPSRFDAILARIQAAGLAFRSTPTGSDDHQVNRVFGGQVVYWSEPDGHVWEILTASYARQASEAAQARPARAAAATLAPALPIVAVQTRYAASYRECLDAVAREQRFLAQTEALPLETIEGFVKNSVATDAIQFFALDGDRVVGWADIFPSWAQAVAHCGSLGMGIHQAYRGQGLGTRLLQACIHKAWQQGLTRIELEARADNAAAIALYEKMGFRHEAVKRQAMRFHGQYHDAVQMSLLRE